MRCLPRSMIASLLFSAACSGRGTMPDAGTRRDSAVVITPSTCVVGDHLCDGIGSQRECLGNGSVGPSHPCPVGQTCIQGGIGCAPCNPGSKRCNPDFPDTVQQCSDDGSGYDNTASCDISNGMTCSGGTCIDRCAVGGSSYLGCEYWSTLTPNSQLVPEFQFYVAISNPQTYPVEVTLEGGALSAPRVRTIEPGAVEVVQLPRVVELIQNRDACFGAFDPTRPCVATSAHGQAAMHTGAYHIRANGPVAAFQFNPLDYKLAMSFSNTNDASLLLPSTVLQNQYIVVTKENFALTVAGHPRVLGGFVSIVGAGEMGAMATVQVNLHARVTDPEDATGTRKVGPGNITLHIPSGDVVQLVGTEMGQDLTGTTITSDQKVAVFVGHDCVNVPANRTACNHLEEQLFPSAVWGKSYVVSALRDRPDLGTAETSVVRLISQRANNTLTFSGIPAPPECMRSLGLGEFCELQVSDNFLVTGTQPFLAVQYMIGLGSPPACAPTIMGPPDAVQCVGDPAMVTEVPIDQFRTEYDFLVPGTFSANYVNTVAPTGTMILLDGTAVTAPATPAGTGFEVRVVPVTSGGHTITGNGARFGIKVYGVAPYTAYMYPGGLDLAPINPPG